MIRKKAIINSHRPQNDANCALKAVISLGKASQFFQFSKTAEICCYTNRNMCPTIDVSTLCFRAEFILNYFCRNVVFSVLHIANWDSMDISNRAACLSLLLRVSAASCFIKKQ